MNHNDTLREKVAKFWSELNGMEITPEMINCVGCRIDGVKTPYCESLCPIRLCAIIIHEYFLISLWQTGAAVSAPIRAVA